MDDDEKTLISYTPPRWNANIFGLRVSHGRLGWWYRFWWRFLLGTTITRVEQRKDND
jgi:hypothetical protein